MAKESIRIDNRKDLLLLLLAAEGAQEAEPIVGVTRLQKYLFLLQERYRWHQKFGIAEPYQFEAYDYGPFDSQLYDDLELLENARLIERQEDGGPEPSAENDEMRRQALEWNATDWEFQPWEEQNQIPIFRLTPEGRKFVERYELSDEDWSVLRELKQHWNRASLNDFLRWLYDEFPSYAEKTRLHHLRPEVK